MSKKGPININTASQEDLMTIKDIGEQRAKIIIKARTEKEGNKLTLEDLKSTPGLPSTIWDTLYATGKIIFEEPEVEPPKDYDAEIQKLRKDYETKLFILEQEKKTMQHEHNNEVKDLQRQIERDEEETQLLTQRLEEQQHQHALEIKNLQTTEYETKEKLHVSLKAVEAEREALTKQIEKFQLDPSVTTNLNQQVKTLEYEKKEMSEAYNAMQEQYHQERDE